MHKVCRALSWSSGFSLRKWTLPAELVPSSGYLINPARPSAATKNRTTNKANDSNEVRIDRNCHSSHSAHSWFFPFFRYVDRCDPWSRLFQRRLRENNFRLSLRESALFRGAKGDNTNDLFSHSALY